MNEWSTRQDIQSDDLETWVRRNGPVTVSDLSRATGLSRTMCRRALRELWGEGRLVRSWTVRSQPCRVYAHPKRAPDGQEWGHVDDPDETEVWQ